MVILSNTVAPEHQDFLRKFFLENFLPPPQLKVPGCHLDDFCEVLARLGELQHLRRELAKHPLQRQLRLLWRKRQALLGLSLPPDLEKILSLSHEIQAADNDHQRCQLLDNCWSLLRKDWSAPAGQTGPSAEQLSPASGDDQPTGAVSSVPREGYGLSGADVALEVSDRPQ